MAIRLAIGGQALGVAVIALMATAVQLKGDILECVPVELYTVFAVLVSVQNNRTVGKETIAMRENNVLFETNRL